MIKKLAQVADKFEADIVLNVRIWYLLGENEKNSNHDQKSKQAVLTNQDIWQRQKYTKQHNRLCDYGLKTCDSLEPFHFYPGKRLLCQNALNDMVSTTWTTDFQLSLNSKLNCPTSIEEASGSPLLEEIAYGFDAKEFGSKKSKDSEELKVSLMEGIVEPSVLEKQTDSNICERGQYTNNEKVYMNEPHQEMVMDDIVLHYEDDTLELTITTAEVVCQ